MTTANVVMCEKFTDRPAVARYVGFGREGTCCGEHQFLLKQTADQTNQPLHFAPIEAPPAALGRDERTQLIAAKLSAEHEIEELKKRGHDLYTANEELKLTVRKLTVKVRELEESSAELSTRYGEAVDALDTKRLEAAELAEELKLLRSVMPSD